MDHTTSSNAYKISRLTILFVSIASVFTLNLYAQVYTATSTVTVTAIVVDPNAPVVVPPPVSGGGGGGGGGGGVPLTTGSDSAVFKGLAYPGSIVTLLKNGVIAAETPASPNGTFEITLRNLNPGTYSFGILAEDSERRKSTLDLYTVFIATGVSTVVEGIFIPPTITTDKVETRRGDPITLLGKAAPNANITLSIHSETELVKKTTSNSSGSWLYKLDSLELEVGDHEGKARSSTQQDLSLFSDIVNFTVGTRNVVRTASTVSSSMKCDLNNDIRVNILDFSIMAFWYKRTGFPVKVDLNADKKIDLADVSILAYCWTG